MTTRHSSLCNLRCVVLVSTTTCMEHCYSLQEMSCTHTTFPGMPHSLPLNYLELPLAFEWPWSSLRADWGFWTLPQSCCFYPGVSETLAFPVCPTCTSIFLSSWPAPYRRWGPLTFLIAKAGTDSILLIEVKQDKKPIGRTFLRLMLTRKEKQFESEEHKG